MIRIINVVGARPQIIKASAISRAIAKEFNETIEDIIVHTGQHYDDNMSSVFFEELKIPFPKYNLKIGSFSHAVQTARMMEGMEEVIIKEKPDYVLLYGDTNSTLAGAVVASKMHIPVIHIEAGLRSFNKSMPEEINRIVCDHVSTLLFTPTDQGFQNLMKEGFTQNTPPYSIDNPGIYKVGDIMYDNSLYFAGIAANKPSFIKEAGLTGNEFILVTIHRDNNTDNSERLTSIFNAFFELIDRYKIDFVIPIHPRTEKILNLEINKDLYKKIKSEKHIKLIPPASYMDMIQLEKNAHLIMTDSGGVQKEAHFFKKPCIILRPETEWIELVENGTAQIADANTRKIVDAFDFFYKKENSEYPDFYGNGNAAGVILNCILDLARNKK